MITLIRPILIPFVSSRPVKKLILDLLVALAKKTDNALDDLLVLKIREALLP